MLEIEEKQSKLFRTKEFWFCESPYDVKSYHSVTFRQCKVMGDFPGFKRSEFTTLVLDLTRDLDDLWKDMSPKGCRYKINRAVREGVIAERSEDYEEFYNLHQEFAQQKGLRYGGYSLDQMQKYGTLFLALLEGEAIAGQLYFEDRNNIRLLLGGSRRFGTDKQKAKIIGFANRMLTWEVIKYAKGKKIKEFDFGGFYTGADPDLEKENINNFKKSFGGEVVTHYDYKKIYSLTYKSLRTLYQFAQSFK